VNRLSEEERMPIDKWKWYKNVDQCLINTVLLLRQIFAILSDVKKLLELIQEALTKSSE